MRILVYGAGVIGSLLAARLARSGQKITMLARGERLRQLQEHGVVLQGFRESEPTATRVDLVEELRPADAYDLVIVSMRKNQVSRVLPSLAANRASSAVLMMVNTAEDLEPWASAVGRERLLLGFPGAGGALDGHLLRYRVVSRWIQPTTMGELDGRTTPRLAQALELFRAAGLPSAPCANMGAWLKCHVAWVGPLSTALYAANGSARALGGSKSLRLLLIQAVRENLNALQRLGVAIEPSGLRLWSWAPAPVLDRALAALFKGRTGAEVIEPHANKARDEMELLRREMRALTLRSGLPTPAADELEALASAPAC
jgi:2-dehydropantoate 2-reductase